MNTLPRTVIDEIFDLRYHVSDQAIEHVADELSRFGCVVSNHTDYDMAVVVYFNRSIDRTGRSLEGELRIDRIQKQFQISAKYGDEMVMPAFGDWDLVMEYLVKVLED